MPTFVLTRFCFCIEVSVIRLLGYIHRSFVFSFIRSFVFSFIHSFVFSSTSLRSLTFFAAAPTVFFSTPLSMPSRNSL